MTEAPTDPEMTWAQVLDLVTRLDSSTYADVELEMPGLRLRMSTTALSPASGGAGQPTSTSIAPSAPAAPPESGPEPDTSAEAARAATGGSQESASAPTDLVDVTAPMLGTFYRRPSPDAAPYVEVGSEVTDDTTVGIVEVMKLMNQVTAGVTGTVVEVLAADGDMVEHDQVIVRVDVGTDS